MSDLYVPAELHAFLVASGVGQAPAAAPSLAVPSIWVDPKAGPPRPRTGEACTVTLRAVARRPAAQLEAWIQETFVDVIVRHATSAAAATSVHRQIRDLLHPISAHGGRKQWTMGALLVEYSDEWRGEQPLPFQQTGDAVTYDSVTGYRLGARRKSLAGQPYVP